MNCERCKKRLGVNEGVFITYRGENICVCSECVEDIRQINILAWEKDYR